MKDMDSLTRLRLKTVGGYVSLMALFIIASVIVVCKSGNLEENSKRYSENIDRRALSEGAFLQLFDLTQLGGQAAILDSTKIAAPTSARTWSARRPASSSTLPASPTSTIITRRPSATYASTAKPAALPTAIPRAAAPKSSHTHRSTVVKALPTPPS